MLTAIALSASKPALKKAIANETKLPEGKQRDYEPILVFLIVRWTTIHLRFQVMLLERR